MANIQSNNKRLAKNTLFLYTRMFFVLVVSLYTSRVILNTLGIEDYGIYNVVAGFVSLFGFLNATLSSSIQRFYNYEGTVNGEQGFHQVYITGMIIHIIIAAIIFVILETFGLWYVNKIMVVPAERLQAANIIFQTSIISMLFIIIQIPFIGAIMAKECMNFYAIVSIVDVLLKLGIVIALPHIPYDKLILYGLLSLAINIVNFILYYKYCKHKFSEINFEVKYYPSLFKSILNFSDLFFGPAINAARGIAYQVNNAISGFSQNITIAFRPQIVNSYANNDYSRVSYLMFTESRICFMLIATLITPIIIDINYILHLWLGKTIPAQTNIFAILVLIDLLVCTLNTPCTQVVWATGKIKQYQIGNSIVSLSLLPVCWILLELGFNAASAFIVTIIISIINQIVCLIITNKIFKIGLYKYLKHVISPCVIFIAIVPIIPIILHHYMNESLIRLLLIVFSDIVIAIFLCFILGINKQEKVSVYKFIKQKIK